MMKGSTEEDGDFLIYSDFFSFLCIRFIQTLFEIGLKGHVWTYIFFSFSFETLQPSAAIVLTLN